MQEFLSNLGGISILINIVVLISSANTNSKVSDLKVYIHENFQRKQH